MPNSRSSRRGDAEMWWIIVGAVLVLVVAIVLLVIFTNKTADLGGGLLDCENKGGECLDETSCKEAPGAVSKAFTCQTGVCCFREKQPI